MTVPVPDNVLHAVKLARHFLADAQFRLDYRGFRCPALDDLHADAAGLICDWQGRLRPVPPDVRRLWNPCDPSSGLVPAYVADAAREYRRTRGRRDGGRRTSA
ncbi:hypothetical protein [Chelativorans salis]|uniref:Uncharacterized protein n=1 Tax=Chelativorans salis TaxID=2978478 RepID=A0ABT2LMR1_9HYPH|nr:hypothetical protein [Chelativorans sp. EGI FJ00035]MCT7375737.1 hypothetical protein [Chelativorans sp. EGI FJ00035]